MQEFREYIEHLVAHGGPEPQHYGELNSWFDRIGALVAGQQLGRSQVRALWSAFGQAFSTDTLQGFASHKPHGHAGDFQIIDRIYQHWLSPVTHLRNWDHFFHAHPATAAVRNRKDYFKALMQALEAGGEVRRVLNVGSGPCRDVHEYLQACPDTRLHFECLDRDEKAIAYAQQLLGDAQVVFHRRDAFRFKPAERYDLIWSAGLFDYLDDRYFVALLGRLGNLLQPGGELVVGNFTEPNPSRHYMEFGEWFLTYRSAEQLLKLAAQTGIPWSAPRVEHEPSGLNLFLRLRRG